jgi:hypothetical protein
MPNPYAKSPTVTKKKASKKRRRPGWAKGKDSINANERKLLEKVEY